MAGDSKGAFTLRPFLAPSIFDCTTELDSSEILQTLLMAGELQGRGNDIIYSGNTRVTMFTWVWCGVLMLPLVLINYSPNLIAQPVHAPLSFLHANLALYSPVNMVRPRQRMLSHRDSNRKGSSRPSTETETFPHCHCHCPHSGGASPLRHSQYLEVSSPGSSSSLFFGSTVFTFNKTLNCPWINTHVSVLFIDEVQNKDGTSAHQEFTSPVNIAKATELPSMANGKAMERPHLHTKEVQTKPEDKARSDRGERGSNRKQKNMDGTQLWRRFQKFNLLQGVRSCCSKGIQLIPFFGCPCVQISLTCLHVKLFLCQCVTVAICQRCSIWSI